MAITPVTLDYLKALFPEFAGSSADQVTALNDALGPIYVSETVFGTNARYALALVIAHNMKLSQLRGDGAITSKRAGGFSTSHSAPMKMKGTDWDLTTYGQRFDALCRQFGGSMRFIPPSGGLPAPFSFVASTARQPQGTNEG